jgi:hypothetical protein
MLRTRPARHRQPSTRPTGRVSTRRIRTGTTVMVGCLAVVLLPGAPHTQAAAPASTQRQGQAQLLAAGLVATNSTQSAPANSSMATMTAPADGSTVSAEEAVTLTAVLSPDLVTALQADGTGACYFTVGDDANSTPLGTINLTARTCTGTWEFSYGSDYTVAGWVNTPSRITYSTPPITVTVTGGANQRCTGDDGPGICSYHWTEVYYTAPNHTRHGRICDIDGGCEWQTTHTSWLVLAGEDYWINDTGQTLPDGNLAEAYLCVGSSPIDWTSYSDTHDFDTLLSQPETSASPVDPGAC